MTEQIRATCPRRHRLVRFEVTPCEAGHDHREFTCPMRRGTRPCGLVVVVPPYGASCWSGKGER